MENLKLDYEDPFGPSLPDDPLECVLNLRSNILCLTTQGGSDLEYIAARCRVMSDPMQKKLLPSFVRHSTEADTLRSALSTVAHGDGSWAKRKAHVMKSFEPLIHFLEGGGCAADAAITDALTSYDAPAVQAAWIKAMDRRSTDPEGAVTAASTLLEEVCKHIIEDSGGKWEKKWATPKLYSEAALLLNLAPSQHQEDLFKSILGSCQNVVQSIGSFRNDGGGDAHAGGRNRIRPQPRHAALVVNLAGSMALFLIETWKARSEGG